MNHAIRFLSIFLGAVGIAHAVPTAINYQGRLTDGDGNPASGSKLFSLSLYDAATAGNELYTETIGSIAVDDNGIYNFQFGANGTSTVAEAETLAVTDGSSTIFNATPSSTPIAGTLSVSDGTYSWNEVDGNPGELASATTQLGNGFVIGYAVTNGGEGYTTAPVVTINGDGIGATATAEVTNGVVTAINVGDVGSGYTNATVSIAEPPAPFVVDYSAGELTFTYEAAPSAGVEITASYDANDTSIVGALSAADSHWLELNVDGTPQTPRERILSVPFAQVAGRVNYNSTPELDLLVSKLGNVLFSTGYSSFNSLNIRADYDVSHEFVTQGGSWTLMIDEAYVRAVNWKTYLNSGGGYVPYIKYLYSDGTSHQNTEDLPRSGSFTNQYPWKLVSGYNLSYSGGYFTSISSTIIESRNVEFTVSNAEFNSGDVIIGYDLDDTLMGAVEFEFTLYDIDDNLIYKGSTEGERFTLNEDTNITKGIVSFNLTTPPALEGNDSLTIHSISLVPAP